MNSKRVLTFGAIAVIAFFVIGAIGSSISSDKISSSPIAPQSSTSQVTSITQQTWRQKLVAINQKVSLISEQGSLLWQKWKAGDITAQQFFNESRPFVVQLENIMNGINLDQVPSEWKDSFRYYQGGISALRTAYEQQYRYALEKQSGFKTLEAEVSMLNSITRNLNDAANLIQQSNNSMPDSATTTQTQIQPKSQPLLKKYAFNGTNINVTKDGTRTSISNEKLYSFGISTKGFKVSWQTDKPVGDYYWAVSMTTCSSGACAPGESYGDWYGVMGLSGLNGTKEVDMSQWLQCAKQIGNCTVVGQNTIYLTLWVRAFDVGRWTITIEEEA